RGDPQHVLEGDPDPILDDLERLVLGGDRAALGLAPFDIGGDHAAAVDENVGYYGNLALVEDDVGLGGGRAVGAFDHGGGANLAGVVAGDLVLAGARREDIHLGQEQLVVGDALARRALERAVLRRAGEERGDVDPFRIA